MTTLDLRQQWKHLYAPSAKKIELVDVPEFKFVMIDGRIEPGRRRALAGLRGGDGRALRRGVHPQVHSVKVWARMLSIASGRKQLPICGPA